MYHIITNPVAGRGNALQYQAWLSSELTELGLQCTTHVTEKARDGFYITQKICENPSDCMGIIGIGGDGTIQEVVAGLAKTFCNNATDTIPIPLGIFPGGSGNDFAMAIEGGKNAYKKKYRNNKEFIARCVAKRIATNTVKRVDLIQANDEAYLVAGNIGIDARIVHNAIELKPKFGGQAYLVAAYKSIMQHKNIPLEINIDGHKITQDVTLVAICNNRTYGGGLCIAPSAKFDDGKITLCIVNGMSRTKLGVLFPSLLIEKHTRLKDISFINCEEVCITLPTASETTLCLDGNLSQETGEIRFKIMPNVLDVFM